MATTVAVREHGQLAQQIARANFQRRRLERFVLGQGAQLAADDNEESMPGIALFEDHFVLLVNPLMQEFINLQKFLVGKFVENRDAFQHLDFLCVLISTKESHWIRFVRQKQRAPSLSLLRRPH